MHRLTTYHNYSLFVLILCLSLLVFSFRFGRFFIGGFCSGGLDYLCELNLLTDTGVEIAVVGAAGLAVHTDLSFSEEVRFLGGAGDALGSCRVRFVKRTDLDLCVILLGFGYFGFILVEGLARSNEEIVSFYVRYISGCGCCGAGGCLIFSLCLFFSLILRFFLLIIFFLIIFLLVIFLLVIFLLLIFFLLILSLFFGLSGGRNLYWIFCSELSCGDGRFNLLLTILDFSIVSGIGRAL